MKTLEILQHTMRCKPGVHLSQQGVTLARFVGQTIGPYDLVVTSPLPRAAETAIAMGFEVNETIEALGKATACIVNEIRWPNSFAGVMQVVAQGGDSAKLANNQAKLWEEIASRIAESGRALIVTHGGVLELGAVASIPDANHKKWGEAVGYCEGVRLTYDERGCRHLEVLRVPQELRSVAN